MLDSDDIPLRLPCLIVDALADTDNIYQPAARVFANFIASKLSPLTDVEIARLTNNEISRLIHKLPEAEVHRLILDEISGLSELFANIGQDIFREFSNEFIMLLWILLGFTCINVALFIFQSYKEGQSSKHDAIVTTNATQGRPKPSMKPILLSKYPGTPDLKGLKGLAETCIQENSTGFRQESTSRVVVRSSRSIVDDLKSLS